MLRSMTGFAASDARGEWGVIGWELRAVNHRYLDVTLRLPEDFRAQEPAFRAQLAAVLSRGKVEASLRHRPDPTAAGGFMLDERLIDQLLEAARRVAGKLPETAPPCSLDVLRWPGVVKEAERDLGPLHAAASQALERALQDLQAAREREGERLREMLTTRIAAIGEQVADVRARLPAVRSAIREKLEQRLGQLVADVDPQRLEQELVMLAQKLDVDEELDRLDSHLVEFGAALGKDEPIGRRLDFLLQEFNREANTLGSKSQDAQTTKAAVELKVLIEQLREQVQNVE